MTLKKKKPMTSKLAIPKEFLKPGERLTKTEVEKMTFLKEVAKHKAQWFLNYEIAEFYKVWLGTIWTAIEKITELWLQIYKKDRIGLIEDQLLEIDSLTEQTKVDLRSPEIDVETKIKLRKEIRDNNSYKAKLQWLLIERTEVNNVWNPTELLLAQFNVYNKPKDDK